MSRNSQLSLDSNAEMQKPSTSKASVSAYRRFNFGFFVATLLPVVSVGILNAVVDPYGVFNSPKVAGWTQAKPEKAKHDRLFKAADVTRVKPTTIFLGSSRTNQGLDPAHPALSNHQPAYNLALNGPNPYEQLRYLQHAIANNPDLDLVVIGVDFFMFNAANANQPGFSETRLEQKGLVPQDIINVSFSFSALQSSWETIAVNRSNSAKEAYQPNGFKPYKNIDLSESATNWRFRYSINDYYKLHSNYQFSDQYLNDFQKLVALCKTRGIELKVFISPAHAAQWEAVRATGQWSTFEDWKRKLAKITPVWDFSGYNSITTELIGADMQNYADSSHYRESVGNLVLNRIFAYQEEKVPSDFGVLLTPDNIESHLAKIRSDREVWTKNRPTELKLVQDLKLKLTEK